MSHEWCIGLGALMLIGWSAILYGLITAPVINEDENSNH